MDTVKVQKRNFALKAKQLRRSGFIPGSVFGGALAESVSIQIDEAEANRLIREKREGSKLKLDIEGQIVAVQLKEKTVTTLKNEILQISFQALKADQKVNSIIHIILENTEKIAGTLEKMLLEIPYASLPENMIDTITVDVDGMAPGSVLTVGDIPELQSENIELQVDAEEIVLRINQRKNAVIYDTEQTAEQ